MSSKSMIRSPSSARSRMLPRWQSPCRRCQRHAVEQRSYPLDGRVGQVVELRVQVGRHQLRLVQLIQEPRGRQPRRAGDPVLGTSVRGGHVQPAHQRADAQPVLVPVRVEGASAPFRIDGEEKLLLPVRAGGSHQVQPVSVVVGDRRHDRQVEGRALADQPVLLLDGLVRPASGAVELGDVLPAVGRPETVHAVHVAGKAGQRTVHVDADDRLDRLHRHVRREQIEGAGAHPRALMRQTLIARCIHRPPAARRR